MRDTENASVQWAQWLSRLLRLGACVEMLAFPWVIAPRDWMELSHLWLGMGEMPAGTVVDFTIRQSSFFYGMHGVLMWWLSHDVLRFRPLVRLIGYTFLLFGPVFLIIDWSTGTPLWWTLCDPAVTAIFGGLVLMAERNLSSHSPQPAQLAEFGNETFPGTGEFHNSDRD
ncbi:MAG: hypothetical protein KDA75_09515 [Planctomycetaceae bacterium]|nr:hypothetical protein [Planctomycetaceae bacterium]